MFAVDAVALLSYLVDRLPKKASNMLDSVDEDNKVLIPSIVIGEILYTIYKGKEIFGTKISPNKIPLLFQLLSYSKGIRLVDMDLKSWEIFDGLNIPVLHDRMIVACAKRYNAEFIITSDKEIQEVYPYMWG